MQTELSLPKLLLYLAPAPIIHIIETYLFSDWQFLAFLFVLIGIDTALGFIKAFNENELDSEDFAHLFKKVIVYLVILILTHVLVHFTVDGEQNILFSWFNSAAYSSLMVRESLSILKNLGKVYPGLVTTGLLKKLKSFDADGNSK